MLVSAGSVLDGSLWSLSSASNNLPHNNSWPTSRISLIPLKNILIRQVLFQSQNLTALLGWSLFSTLITSSSATSICKVRTTLFSKTNSANQTQDPKQSKTSSMKCSKTYSPTASLISTFANFSSASWPSGRNKGREFY
jgi:hypothetical protein